MCLAHMDDPSEGDMPQMIKDWDYTRDLPPHEDLRAHLDETSGPPAKSAKENKVPRARSLPPPDLGMAGNDSDWC